MTRSLSTFAAASAALMMTLGASAAQAAIISPVSAIGSSSYPGYADSFAIDTGAGGTLTDWASLRQGAASFLRLDLGAVYTLANAIVTDRVTSGGGNGGFVGGLYDFTTQFSLQGFTDATFTTAIGGPMVFNHAAPGSPASPADFALTASLGGLTTRYVQYQVLTTAGDNPGLSDIRFNTAGVPEPAAWALMIVGFGGVGAVLRRRRQTAVA